MIFTYELEVPADTQEDDPVSVEMKFTHGIIHFIEVIFQAGCRHNVKLSIRRSLHQVWPTNPAGSLKGDWFPISGPVWYPIEDQPYQLEAHGWSPGTTYPHTVMMRFWVQRRDVLLPHEQQAGMISRMATFLMGRRG